tara:strand:- start:3290 stop:3700 length:411 start_codon:yes stop_codon:yes gene_type:complete
MNGVTLDKLKELSILVPAVHIMMCFTYLLFYYMSFGYGIHVFSSPADIFAISLGELLPNYVFLALGMVVGIGHGKLLVSITQDIRDDELNSLKDSKLSRFILFSKKNPHLFAALIGYLTLILFAILSGILAIIYLT